MLKTDVAERETLNRQMISDARDALRQMRQSGLGYRAADVMDYLRARIADRTVLRPEAKKWK